MVYEGSVPLFYVKCFEHLEKCSTISNSSLLSNCMMLERVESLCIVLIYVDLTLMVGGAMAKYLSPLW